MKRKLRILHIGNGKAFKIEAIVNALAVRGHEVHMVPVPPSAKTFERAVWHSFGESGNTLQRFLALRRLVKVLRPDVVHAHNAWGPGWYGAFAGHHPYVIHAYGGDLLPEQYRERSLLQRRLTAWACKSADRVVVTGGHMVAAAAGLSIDPRRCVLLPRGVDVARFTPGLDISGLRAKLAVPADAFVVFSPRYQIDEALYNVDVVLEAFARLRQVLPSAVCLQMYAPGKDAAAKKLRERARALGIADAYRLVPAVGNAEMPLYYNLADVAVSVPSSDGFPVTVLEASACGCPLIVSALPYTGEWFDGERNGLVIPVRDSTALAAALRRVHEDSAWARGMGLAGRERVEQRASYECCMDKLEALYFELLDQRAPRDKAA